MKAINQLWEQFQAAIDAAYDDAKPSRTGDGHAVANALADYTTERNPWRMANLLGRETANERQHRRGSEAPKSFSVGDAAKLLIMTNAADGAEAGIMPPAHWFLTMRPTMVESQVIGFLTRSRLSAKWINEVQALDYSKLMGVN